MAHAGGRPTEYDPKMVNDVYQYLLTVGREQTKLPKRVDLAIRFDVDEDTLNNWGKEHAEFFGALTMIDNMQKSQLIDDGMYGGKEVNARIAQFLLSANHGMVEKSATDLTTQGEKLPAPQIVIDTHDNKNS